ncbi:formate dehydrogenase accessory sulfurtransferase FdhD [Corynebacterium ciconiae]|uniref:formate dehydrogenase accessory sulfurtransferase FdhD n=1 Tax=Corynebacterium ciconiae TaxID=227319 RepID=UPI000370128B|nr:formate dehydrogenase accessory sulfurtransferase FdhD [Corynebacterium ciconiae]
MGRIIDNPRITRVVLREEEIFFNQRSDAVAVEEPLELRVGGNTYTTTMRTAGNDIEWMHGFLYSEGLITSAEDVTEARYCAGATGEDGANTYNVLECTLKRLLPLRPRLGTMTSACGVCGTNSIQEITRTLRHPMSPIAPDPRLIAGLPAALRTGQKAFEKTGGIHAAGLFAPDGTPLFIREDVGRHNACDKVIGAALLAGMEFPLASHIMVMSSRASFELVQKTVLAGCSGLVAVSAATSLAVDLARDTGLLLVGFNRGDRFNLYSGELATESEEPSPA